MVVSEAETLLVHGAARLFVREAETLLDSDIEILLVGDCPNVCIVCLKW